MNCRLLQLTVSDNYDLTRDLAQHSARAEAFCCTRIRQLKQTAIHSETDTTQKRICPRIFADQRESDILFQFEFRSGCVSQAIAIVEVADQW